jgi:hypothetical protein
MAVDRNRKDCETSYEQEYVKGTCDKFGGTKSPDHLQHQEAFHLQGDPKLREQTLRRKQSFEELLDIVLCTTKLLNVRDITK